MQVNLFGMETQVRRTNARPEAAALADGIAVTSCGGLGRAHEFRCCKDRQSVRERIQESGGIAFVARDCNDVIRNLEVI